MRVKFKESHFKALEIPDNANLSEHLDKLNSPVLFGCRTGICGTCLIKIIHSENIIPPDADEVETLELLAPNHSKARLACQIICSGELHIEYLGL